MARVTNYIYVLDFHVDPGGARKDVYYYLRNRGEVLKAIQDELEDPFLSLYGHTAMLYVCERLDDKVSSEVPVYEVKEVHDIMSMVTYKIGKFAPISFKKSNSPPAHPWKDEDETSGCTDNDGPINFESTNLSELDRYLTTEDEPDVNLIISDRFEKDTPVFESTEPSNTIYFTFRGPNAEGYELKYGLNDFS